MPFERWLQLTVSVLVFHFQIFIDSQDRQLVASPYLTKALIERLNLHYPHTFSIQTLAENGKVSRMVNTGFDDILPERHSSASDSASDVPADADQCSLLCGSHCGDGEQRVVSRTECLPKYQYS